MQHPQSSNQTSEASPEVAGHIRYESAKKFIKFIGGDNAAREIILAGAAFLCVNWTVYGENRRHYFARVSRICPMDVRTCWSDMDSGVRQKMSEGLIQACYVALEIVEHPEMYIA